MPRDTVVVGRTGQRYSCPTVTAVDRHITRLQGELGKTGIRQAVLDDIDLLLDQRNQLVDKVPAVRVG